MDTLGNDLTQMARDRDGWKFVAYTGIRAILKELCQQHKSVAFVDIHGKLMNNESQTEKRERMKTYTCTSTCGFKDDLF